MLNSGPSTKSLKFGYRNILALSREAATQTRGAVISSFPATEGSSEHLGRVSFFDLAAAETEGGARNSSRRSLAAQETGSVTVATSLTTHHRTSPNSSVTPFCAVYSPHCIQGQPAVAVGFSNGEAVIVPQNPILLPTNTGVGSNVTNRRPSSQDAATAPYLQLPVHYSSNGPADAVVSLDFDPFHPSYVTLGTTSSSLGAVRLVDYSVQHLSGGNDVGGSSHGIVVAEHSFGVGNLSVVQYHQSRRLLFVGLDSGTTSSSSSSSSSALGCLDPRSRMGDTLYFGASTGVHKSVAELLACHPTDENLLVTSGSVAAVHTSTVSSRLSNASSTGPNTAGVPSGNVAAAQNLLQVWDIRLTARPVYSRKGTERFTELVWAEGGSSSEGEVSVVAAVHDDEALRVFDFTRPMAAGGAPTGLANTAEPSGLRSVGTSVSASPANGISPPQVTTSLTPPPQPHHTSSCGGGCAEGGCGPLEPYTMRLTEKRKLRAAGNSQSNSERGAVKILSGGSGGLHSLAWFSTKINATTVDGVLGVSDERPSSSSPQALPALGIVGVQRGPLVESCGVNIKNIVAYDHTLMVPPTVGLQRGGAAEHGMTPAAWLDTYQEDSNFRMTERLRSGMSTVSHHKNLSVAMKLRDVSLFVTCRFLDVAQQLKLGTGTRTCPLGGYPGLFHLFSPDCTIFNAQPTQQASTTANTSLVSANASLTGLGSSLAKKPLVGGGSTSNVHGMANTSTTALPPVSQPSLSSLLGVGSATPEDICLALAGWLDHFTLPGVPKLTQVELQHRKVAILIYRNKIAEAANLLLDLHRDDANKGQRSQYVGLSLLLSSVAGHNDQVPWEGQLEALCDGLDDTLAIALNHLVVCRESGPSKSSVFMDSRVPLLDRIALCCLCLPQQSRDQQFSKYYKEQVDMNSVAQFLFVGLNEVAATAQMQEVIDLTGDVQLGILLFSTVVAQPNPTTAGSPSTAGGGGAKQPSASQQQSARGITIPKGHSDPEAAFPHLPIWRTWTQAYRCWLNGNGLWKERAKFDVEIRQYERSLSTMVEPSGRSSSMFGAGRGGGAQKTGKLGTGKDSLGMTLQCLCEQPLHGTAPVTRANFAGRGGMMGHAGMRAQTTTRPCSNPECLHDAMPVCSVCSQRMEAKDLAMSRRTQQHHQPPSQTSSSLEKASAGASGEDHHPKQQQGGLSDTWFAWCCACHHGGHYSHLKGWFSRHRKCPVEDCTCFCRLE